LNRFKGGYIFLIILLLIGAICKSLNAPLSSILVDNLNPMLVSSLMSLGAVIVGLPVFLSGIKKERSIPERHLHKKDTPFLLGIIACDLTGNILYLVGLTMCLASAASLTKSFGVVATAAVAFIFLKERVSKRLWIAITLITLGCITIAAGDITSLIASPGILLVLASCICSSISHALKKKVADRNPGTVVMLTNIAIMVISAIIAFIMGGETPDVISCISGVILGMIVFGLPGIWYQIAARKLDATKCSAVYGLAPFLGAGISFIIFQETPTLAFFISFLLLIPGFYLVIVDKDQIAKSKGKDVTEESVPIEMYHDSRGYLVSVGFLIGFGAFLAELIHILGNFKGTIFDGINVGITGLILSVIQIVIGCIILIFRKRDMAGMTILMLGFATLLLLYSNKNPIIVAVVGIMSLFLVIILLLGKEKKKYAYSLLFFLASATYFVLIFTESVIIRSIIIVITTIYFLILAIASFGLLPKFRLTSILAEDETTDFKIIGTTLCCVIAAISVIPWMITYLISPGIVDLEIIKSFSIISGIMIGIIAIFMLFLGKESKFIGSIFLCFMTFLIISGFTIGSINYIAGIIMFIAGLFCFLRKKSYLLVGLMCILYGISSFMSVVIHGETVLVISQFCLQLLTFLVAAYLAIAVFSQNKKLPLF